MARLLEKYRASVVGELKEKFAYKNSMQAPEIKKIVVNMGVGEATKEKELLDDAVQELATIVGQRPVITKAKKSVAGFKLREGMSVGCKVTLRGKQMYEFMDRFIHVAIPRIRDFRGLPTNSFDGFGNYSLGLDDQTVFPELNLDKVKHTQGMDITFVISGSSDEESYEMLKLMGMPFKK